jgi:tetratricopeptide (TPR) repeat protein
VTVQLRAALSERPVHVVGGMGGVGKTATVTEYCDRHRDDYDVIWWVPAEESALVPDRLAELARALDVARENETVISAVSRLRSDLARRDRWLIVFDNAVSPEALRPHLMPGTGHTLITSRNPSWEGLAAVTLLDLLGRPESRQLLKIWLPRLDDQDADRMAEALGDLPLALSQAAAYVADTGLAVAEYLDLLAARAPEVLARGTPGNYPMPFASGLQLAMERIAADRPAAAELLTLAAFMAPEPIPLTLFSAHRAALPEPLAAAAGDPLTFADLMRLLRQRGLARVMMGTVQLHRLVQAVLREHAPAGTRQIAVALLAAELLAPLAAPDPARWRDLLPHVLAAVSPGTFPPGQPLPAETERLAYAAAKHLRTRGDARAARPLLECVLQSRQATYGPDHRLVANALINVGWALRDLGDPEQAYQAYARALRIREHLYGMDHPQVATALTNCGLSLRELGRPEQARPLHERALSIRIRAFGPGHRHVATVLTYLGQALADLGDPAGARPLLEQALGIRESEYGPDHRHVATVLTDLGRTMADLGEPGRARDLLARALNIRELAYGPDHPRVAVTAGLLALVIRDLGDRATAYELLVRSHSLLAAAWGSAHPLARKAAADAASLA